MNRDAHRSCYGYPVTVRPCVWARSAASLLALMAALLASAYGARRRERGERRAESASANSKRASPRSRNRAPSLNGRLRIMGEWLGSRQADLARVMSERLDNVGARLGAGLESARPDDGRQS